MPGQNTADGRGHEHDPEPSQGAIMHKRTRAAAVIDWPEHEPSHIQAPICPTCPGCDGPMPSSVRHICPAPAPAPEPTR
jgi:hypothetical protein